MPDNFKAQMRKLIVATLAISMFAIRASAEPPRRVALVIGNSTYAAAPHLANPGADAKLIAEALRRSGFTYIVLQVDLSKSGFERALQEFQKKADGAEVALVYYAGHGLEVDGRNWLVPVDATLADERDLPFQAIDLDVVLGTVTHAKELSVVVLDACRDNPFTRSLRRTSGTRGIGSRGLAAIEVTGTLVLYAQRAGQTALDGLGSDSPFATALAKRLPEPGVDIRILVSKVRDDVLAMTGGKQEPFSYGSLPGVPLELVPGLSVPAPSAVDLELAAFNEAATLNTSAGWDAYLGTYPQGRYSGVAKRERAALAPPSQESHNAQESHNTLGNLFARFAYIRAEGSENSRHYTLVLRNGPDDGFRIVLDSPKPIRSPVWSPDGKSIAYVSFEDGAAAIYVQDVRTGQRRLVSAHQGVNGSPAWSPDGQKLALTLGSTNQDVWVLDLGTQQLTRITDDKSVDTDVVWAPTGRALYFTSERDRNPQIFRVDLPSGKAPQRVAVGSDYAVHPNLSPDGSQLVITSLHDGGYWLTVENVDTGTTSTVCAVDRNTSARFGPKGDTLIYSESSGSNSVIVVTPVSKCQKQTVRSEGADISDPAVQ
jgi:Caspase domain/WD40-like Beta Propeller Repeat